MCHSLRLTVVLMLVAATASVAPATARNATAATAQAATEQAATDRAAMRRVPAGFVLSSTSWLDRHRGALLGFAPCAAGQCAVLLRTWDGGHDWWRLPAPDVELSPVNYQVRVHFADGWNGLVTDGQRLYATHLAGLAWRQVELADVQPPVAIGALASNDRFSYAVVTTGSGAETRTRLFATPLDRSRWAPVPGVEIPAGVGGGGDVVAAGDAAHVALAAVHRANGYWSTAGAGWQRQAPPCPVHAQPHLGLAGETVFAMCSFNPGMGYMYKDLVVSRSGGPFEPVASAPRVGITTGVAAASKSVVVATAVGVGAAWVHRGVDGGRTWSTPLVIDSPPFFDLDFQDDRHGVVLWGGPPWNQAALYRTCDGGATWEVLSLDGGGTPCPAS